MSKTPTLASINGANLSGAELKAFLVAQLAALNSAGLQEGDRSTITANTTLTVTQAGLVPVDCTGGNVTLTLPTSGATTADAVFLIRRLDSTANTLSIARGGSDTIETAATSQTVDGQGVLGLQLPAGGTDWKIFARGGATPFGARDMLGLGAGDDIDSAATLDLTDFDGKTKRVNGTTATSALTMNDGDWGWLIPQAAWPLTYHATTMPVQGGASYTCAAGDMVFVAKQNSTITILVFKKNGTPIALGDGTVTPAKLSQPLTSGTVQDATSGTSVSFAGIPSWVIEIDLIWLKVSLSGTDNFLVRIGDAGGMETSAYESSASLGGTGATATNGFVVRNLGAPDTHNGVSRLKKVTGNTWVFESNVRPYAIGTDGSSTGNKTLSDTLTQLDIVPTGSNTFDGANAQFQIHYR